MQLIETTDTTKLISAAAERGWRISLFFLPCLPSLLSSSSLPTLYLLLSLRSNPNSLVSALTHLFLKANAHQNLWKKGVNKPIRLAITTQNCLHLFYILFSSTRFNLRNWFTAQTVLEMAQGWEGLYGDKHGSSRGRTVEYCYLPFGGSKLLSHLSLWCKCTTRICKSGKDNREFWCGSTTHRPNLKSNFIHLSAWKWNFTSKYVNRFLRGWFNTQ